METINDRIQIIIDQHYKGNVTAFARDVGVTQGTIRDIVSGRRNNPTSKTIDRILNVKTLNINPNWLITGRTTMPINDEIVRKNKISEAKIVDTTAINTTTAPLISQYAAAGYLQGFSDPEYIEQQPLYIAAQKFSGGNYVAFEIRGDSMDDGLKHSIGNGDLVLGKELKRDYWTSRLHYPKVFVIVHKQDGILCKEIIAHDVEQGIITCHSFNPEHRDFTLNLQDVAQLFYIKEKKTGY